MNYERKLIIDRLIAGTNIFFKQSTLKRFVNISKVLYSYYASPNKVVGMPFLIKIEPTNVCDLDCTFCLRRNINYGYGYMNLDKFKEIIDYFSPYAYFVFLHLWGESTLHKQIGEMIHYVKEKNICSYLSVNFNNVEEQTIKALVNNRLDYLTISVDGVSQESYSKFREKGNFDKVISNIKKLILYKRENSSKYPRVILQFIAMKHNQHEINGIRKLAKELQVDKLDIKTLDVKPLFFSSIKDKFIPFETKMQRRAYSKKTKRTRKCFWLFGTTHITWNAKIKPCCVRVFNDEFGDFSHHDFEEVWKSGKVNQLRQNLLNRENITNSDCLKCDFLEGQNFLT